VRRDLEWEQRRLERIERVELAGAPTNISERANEWVGVKDKRGAG
jgi:hypothetical protein